VTPPRARLFVALELPEGVRERLARWARTQLADRDGLRLIAPGQIHVTLCFLGWREEADIPLLGEVTSACIAAAPDVSLGQPAWLPPRRPRVLAVDLVDGSGALTALQARVSGALADRAGYEPEARAYRPHVTVARVRSGTRMRAADRATLDPPGGPPFDGAALTLYRSRLSSEGAHYEAVMRAEL
jgi:2'-5' RNA ligase